MRAHEEEPVDPRGRYTRAELAVRALGRLAELEHLAQDGEAARGVARAEGLQRRGHRAGVRVVAVVQHDGARREREPLHAHGRRGERLERAAGRLERHADGACGGGRRERIRDVMPSRDAEAHRRRLAGGIEREARAVDAVVDDVSRADVARVAERDARAR